LVQTFAIAEFREDLTTGLRVTLRTT